MKQIIEEGAAGAAPGQETMIPLIETAHISKRFGGIVALNDAQMKCYRGETHVLIGENGAGKSTLICIVTGTASPSSGSVELFGERGGRGLAAARRRMGYMPDASSAYPGLSARENGFATVA